MWRREDRGQSPPPEPAMRLIALLLPGLLAAGVASAEPFAGLDDPAFALPFATLLERDDTEAVAALHAAAEAGSLPALAVLPAAQVWVPPTGTLAERNRTRRINGTMLGEAVAAELPLMAVWAGGEPSADQDELLRRAMVLAGSGEALKGGLLFGTWINQTGGGGAVPPEILDLPLPAYLLSRLPVARALREGRLDGEAGPLLQALIGGDHPAGWMALADLAADRGDGTPSDPVAIEAVWREAGVEAATAAERLADAALANRRARYLGGEPLTEAEAERVRALLAATGDLALVAPFCAQLCPDTPATCETAALVLGLDPLWSGGRTLPPASVIAPEDFFATPRGSAVLIDQAATLTTGESGTARLAAAQGIDACFGDAVAAAE